MRRMVLAILLIGLLGTGLELVLIAHHEDAWQAIPLALTVLALLLVGWHGVRPGSAALRLFRGVMVLFVASGLLGMVLHYRANVEFQREIDPSLAGTRLFWKVVRAKAPPSLAPAVMAELGLLGLLFAYRGPAAGGASVRPGPQGG